MHASVTDEAHLIWRQFTTTQGTTTAALCEALAPELERLVDLPEPRWPVMWREVTLRSRSIAAERRFR